MNNFCGLQFLVGLADCAEATLSQRGQQSAPPGSSSPPPGSSSPPPGSNSPPPGSSSYPPGSSSPPPGYSSYRQGASMPVKRKRNMRNIDILVDWIRAHPQNPYPDKPTKVYLTCKASMTMKQLNDWFANARRDIKRIGMSNWP